MNSPVLNLSGFCGFEEHPVLNLSAFGGFILFSSSQIMINLEQDCLSVFGGFTAQSSTQILIN